MSEIEDCGVFWDMGLENFFAENLPDKVAIGFFSLEASLVNFLDVSCYSMAHFSLW